MLLAILNILKIVGIVILAILGIILFILLLLLFIPFRYRVVGQYDEKKKYGRVNVSWLLHFISAKLLYEEKSLDLAVKIIGIPVFKKNILGGSENKEEKSKDRKSKDASKGDSASVNDSKKEDLKKEDFKAEDVEAEEHKEVNTDNIIPLNIDGKDDSVDLDFENLKDESIDVDSDGIDLKVEEEKEKDILSTVLNGFFAVFNFCLFGFFKIFDLILAVVFGILFLVVKGINLLVSSEDNILSTIDRGIDKAGKKLEDAKEGYDSFAARVRELNKKAKSFRFKISDFKNKINDVKRKFRDIKRSIYKAKTKAKNTKDRLGEYKKLYESKRFKKTFAFLKKEVIKLLKHILPRRCKGYIKFGFEEPDKTGKIYGYVAILYGISGKRLKKFDVIPEFERKVLEGNIDIKGHIRLIHVLILAIKVLLNRNIWIIKKKFDKINKRYKDMEMEEGFYSFDDDLDAIS